MNKAKILVMGVTIVMVLSGLVGFAAAKGKPDCTTIQSGEIHASDGTVITTGYDQWGYNYQAHIFNGYLENFFRPYPPVTESDTSLMIKWNDAWLSNKDCDGDGLLDRHYGFDSYIGSGAWETNHMWGTYINDDGKECKWNLFKKIVAVPSDAYVEDNVWYTADGVEIGPVIWGQFAIIQELYNDPCGGYSGIWYNAPAPTGFGYYSQ